MGRLEVLEVEHKSQTDHLSYPVDLQNELNSNSNPKMIPKKSEFKMRRIPYNYKLVSDSGLGKLRFEHTDLGMDSHIASSHTSYPTDSLNLLRTPGGTLKNVRN